MMPEQLKITREYGVAERAPSVGVKPFVRHSVKEEPGVVPRISPCKPGQRAPDRPGSIRGMVIKTMEDHPETRNDDSRLEEVLLKTYFPIKCHQCGADVLLSEEYLARRPKPESIRRRRQELQNSLKNPQLIPTDPDVLSARGFFKECPLAILEDRGTLSDKPAGYSKAICRKCKIRETDDCPKNRGEG